VTEFRVTNMPDEDELEVRVRRLETAMAENARLAEGVEALVKASGQMSDVLLALDRNLQATTQLGTALQTVKDDSVTKGEHETDKRELAALTLTKARQVRTNTIVACVLTLLVALGAAGFAYHLSAMQAYDQCEQRVRNSQDSLIFYQQQLKRPDLSPFERNILTALDQSASKGAQVDCGSKPWV
jgi:hypothetical protein